MLTIFPLWARILLILGVIASVFGLGFAKGVSHEGDRKDAQIANLEQGYAAGIAESNRALIAANARAAERTNAGQFDVDHITTDYQEKKDGQIKALQDRVAALTSGRERMRVDAVCPDAGRGRELPDARAAAGSADGAGAGAELSAGSAGRVATVAQRANGEALKVAALQDLVDSYYRTCGPPAAVNPPDAIAKKRGVIGLGLPNPFDKD